MGGADCHPVQRAAVNLAELYEAQGEVDEALALFLKALNIYEQALGKQDPLYATSLNNLAYLCYSQGKYEETLPLYQEAYHIFKDALGEQHPNTQLCKRNYQSLLQQLGNSKLPETIPKAAPLLNRNAPCPCGSGQRYKHCCGQA